MMTPYPGASVNKTLWALSSLNDLGQAITSTGSFEKITKSGLYLILGTLSAAHGAVFRFDPELSRMMPLARKGIPESLDISLQMNDKDAQSWLLAPNVVEVDALPEYLHDFGRFNRVLLSRAESAFLAPLRVGERLVGILSVGARFSGGRYSEDDRMILAMMCQQLSIALHNNQLFSQLEKKVHENYRLYENLRGIYNETIMAFATAIDAKDQYTRGHSARVADYAVAIGEEVGLDKAELEGLHLAGLLHDIGKITVDNTIIRKTSCLSDEERKQMHRHPAVGYEILSNIRFPWGDLSTLTRHHHEKVDGNGYPDGLRGEDLPVGVRIIALADAFDAMTTDRPYRKQISLEETLKEVKRCMGTHFDSEMARVLFRVLEREISGKENPRIIPHLKQEYDPKRIKQLLLEYYIEGPQC
ncbi:MAG: HD domain-containing protein [bacterium]|nr:HD domain-containing protein [bacterium]